ncbi:hypothetical protein NKH47_23330 [Mesorhizobium sp. M1060]|uniref:hypothetical protein n=1 Tax=unclassified Mesorhizobium TaxID=325217 RepID=UPI001FDAA30A|nr:hypothetical protein [Mesorhizobium sp. L2C089B000]
MDIFDSAIRRKGDLAGVFEHDDTEGPANATAYFYLYEAHDEVVGGSSVQFIFDRVPGRSPKRILPSNGTMMRGASAFSSSALCRQPLMPLLALNTVADTAWTSSAKFPGPEI